MGLIQTSRLPEVVPKQGWHGRFFHSEHMTFAYYNIEAGASLHEHAHPNEEVWHVIDGDVDFTLGTETLRIAAGNAVVVPAGVVHSVEVKMGCRVIVVDYPVRHELAGMKI